MIFDYPGGVPQEQASLIERFEEDIVPYLRREGPRIGDAAMKGDAVAIEAINAYKMFVEGVPEVRALNYRRLCKSLKAMEVART